MRALCYLMLAAAAFAASPNVTFQPSEHTYTLDFGAESKWSGLSAAVKVDGAWMRLADFPSGDARYAKSVARIECRAREPLDRFVLSFEHRERFIVLRASATAARKCTIQG